MWNSFKSKECWGKSRGRYRLSCPLSVSLLTNESQARSHIRSHAAFNQATSLLGEVWLQSKMLVVTRNHVILGKGPSLALINLINATVEFHWREFWDINKINWVFWGFGFRLHLFYYIIVRTTYLTTSILLKLQKNLPFNLVNLLKDWLKVGYTLVRSITSLHRHSKGKPNQINPETASTFWK